MLNQMIVMIYENYSEAMRKAASEEARHLGGLSRMLIGKRSNSEDLLPAFDARLEAELNILFGLQSSSAEVRELADFMLDRVAENRDEPRVKYSLMAVQRHLLPLIGCLNSADASLLIKKFESTIPRQERFPIQKKLISSLKDQAKK